ncbi:non-canonical purine NTP pyrophosphatase [Candidatus Saccharibacteria bacterium]|nr:non-canonical purine NTP pyrophosphatase [Candidatus Saccharibacteria bacterium]
MKLLYLTSNEFKFREAKEVLVDEYGFDLEIMDPDFELYEIQAKTCGEVVAFTAKYGADKLGRPCLKSDTGLYLEALGGLPGPYNAYFDKQIGHEKFLRMLKGEKNRKARIEHCFAYCEPGKDPIVFTGGGTGHIITEMRGKDGKWHDFFYIPDGETRTLAEIGDIDHELKRKYYGDAIHQFAKWYLKK